MSRRIAVTRLLPTVIAVLVAGLPLVVTDRFTLKVLTFAGIDVIVITGLALLFGYAGQISLGHAAFVGIGAYTSAILTVTLGWPWVAGMVAAAALSALGGLLLALPTLRLRGHYLAMATLGFGEIMSIVAREAEPLTGGYNGFAGIAPPEVAGRVLSGTEASFWLVWGVAGVTLLLAFNIVRMRPGRAMRALHGSSLGAEACGIDTVRLKIQVFTLSAALGGIAGGLLAHFVGFISPSSFSLHSSIQFVAKTVLGGSASLAGPALSGVLLKLVENLDAFIPGLPREAAATIQDWLTDVYGITIILIMLFAPNGVAGLLRRLHRKERRPVPSAGEAEA